MASFEAARSTILEHVTALGSERVALADAAGRVLAAPFAAVRDLPLWDNSAMDGFAVRAADCDAPTALPVGGFLPAGAQADEPLRPGTAVRILTGAPVPPGADAVVPFEDADVVADATGRATAIRPRKAVKPGANVRRRGEDLREGEAVLPAGAVLGPAEIGLLATSSQLAVEVVRRPRVAILATGDELVEPGAPLGPGKITNSNASALAAAVRLAGAAPAYLGIAPDAREPLRRLLVQGLAADVLVTSAGVSVGDRDHVREVLGELGVREVFSKVDVKPGRPTTFGVSGTTPVFSLPGNPVSTLLTFELFVRPALRKMLGHRRTDRPVVRAQLAEGLAKKPGRLELLRVRLARHDGAWVARPAGPQDTGILRTSLLADGIALIPADATQLLPGAPVEVHLTRDVEQESP